MRHSLVAEHTDDRILPPEVVENILAKIQSLLSPAYRSMIGVASYWNSESHWARNRMNLSSDRRSMEISILLTKATGGSGTLFTNQYDDASLRAAVRAVEHLCELAGHGGNIGEWMPLNTPRFQTPQTKIWSDSTFNREVKQNSVLVNRLTDRAEASHFLSAGFIQSQGGSASMLVQSETQVSRLDGRWTQAQCSMTVRHPKGTGSGWAGLSGYDFSQLHPEQLADRAYEKCQASLDPVRIEPGRYTVILDAQAVADLLHPMMVGLGASSFWSRESAEVTFGGPFTIGLDKSVNRIRSKLGLKVMDERITISHNPIDPALGVFPEEGLAPVTLVERGILKSLYTRRDYALLQLNENVGSLYRYSYSMSGASATPEAMISETQRGLLVTRFSGVRLLDGSSILCTGMTRDGLWLVENGKISKSVKNFRFTESPLFALNNIVQLGTPVPIFNPNNDMSYVTFGRLQQVLQPVLVPPMKVNDFSFTSTVDAI